MLESFPRPTCLLPSFLPGRLAISSHSPSPTFAAQTLTRVVRVVRSQNITRSYPVFPPLACQSLYKHSELLLPGSSSGKRKPQDVATWPRVRRVRVCEKIPHGQLALVEFTTWIVDTMVRCGSSVRLYPYYFRSVTLFLERF